MKVANAVICLDCDTIFELDHCPKCLSKSFHPLRKWLTPLHSFNEIKEAHYAKKRNLPIQEGREESVLSTRPGFRNPITDPDELRKLDEGFCSRNYGPVVVNNQAESSESKARFSYHKGRIRMESESSFFKRSRWTHAGHAFYRKMVDWAQSCRSFLSREKYYRRDNDTPSLSENVPKFKSGVGKVFWERK